MFVIFTRPWTFKSIWRGEDELPNAVNFFLDDSADWTPPRLWIAYIGAQPLWGSEELPQSLSIDDAATWALPTVWVEGNRQFTWDSDEIPSSQTLSIDDDTVWASPILWVAGTVSQPFVDADELPQSLGIDDTPGWFAALVWPKDTIPQPFLDGDDLPLLSIEEDSYQLSQPPKPEWNLYLPWLSDSDSLPLSVPDDDTGWSLPTQWIAPFIGYLPVDSDVLSFLLGADEEPHFYQAPWYADQFIHIWQGEDEYPTPGPPPEPFFLYEDTWQPPYMQWSAWQLPRLFQVASSQAEGEALFPTPLPEAEMRIWRGSFAIFHQRGGG